MTRTDWELQEPKGNLTEEDEEVVFQMLISMPAKKEKTGYGNKNTRTGA